VIGEIIIDSCIRFFKYACNESLRKVKMLGDRVYYVYNMSADDRAMITTNIYEALKSRVNSTIKVELSRSSKSIVLSSDRCKPLWYRIGLALSDGSILGESRIIFSTTRAPDINTIVRGFRNTRIYIARYMVSSVTGKIMPMVNIVVNDGPVLLHIKPIKYGYASIASVVDILRNSSEALAGFIAGVIEGDGSLDNDNIRISISNTDPLYRILTEIFEGNVKYDEKRYLLRISTAAVRRLGILEAIHDLLEHPSKKRRLARIIHKRRRATLGEIHASIMDVKRTLLNLGWSEKQLLLKLKRRRRGKYLYLYMPAGKHVVEERFTAIREVLRKIGGIIGVDLTPYIKRGNREIVIYDQQVVRLLEALRKRLEEGG